MVLLVERWRTPISSIGTKSWVETINLKGFKETTMMMNQWTLSDLEMASKLA